MNTKKFMEIVNLLDSEHLGSILRDFAEVVLDSLVKEGLLRDIPVVSTLDNLRKTYGAITQQLITNKIKKFWEELSNLSSEERREFVEWMNQNPKQKAVVGETLLLLIDCEDSVEKPLIIARLLEHCSLGNISDENLRELVRKVNRVYNMSDLNYLTSFTSGIQSNPDIAESLKNAGLLNWAGIDFGYVGQPSSAGNMYELNEYGKMLLKYGLDSAV
jgi:hypothetical protein